jgi:hypothetical protein
LTSSFTVGVEVSMPINPEDSTIIESPCVIEPVHFGTFPGVPLPVICPAAGAGPPMSQIATTASTTA